MSEEEAVSTAKAETRQFAKRQLTWLRGNMRSWTWLSKQEMESIQRSDIAFIDF
jgi:tRNA dimethylallyltransferase